MKINALFQSSKGLKAARKQANQQSPQWNKTTPTYHYILVLTLECLLYLNGLIGDFAYDDSRAIKTNQDLLSSTPWYQLFMNDYWGTPIRSSNSHGSYRPIAVLSFRLNYLLHGLSPFGFHLFNLVLHLAVTYLYMKFVGRVLNYHRRTTLISSILFASHPIHVESVTSIVGRADIGAAFFYLLALISYIKFVDFELIEARPDEIGNKCLYVSIGMATLSMLTKEYGVTCLAVCAVYHLFVIHRFFPFSINSYRLLLEETNYRHLRKGLLYLSLASLVLVFGRFQLMGGTPSFAPADNPSSDNSSVIIRFFTFLYLPVFNFWLLIYPRWLSFDWSMEAIPLISTLFDIRNVQTLIFYATLAIFIRKIVKFYFSFIKVSNSQNKSSACTRCESTSHRVASSQRHQSQRNSRLPVVIMDENNNGSSEINRNSTNSINAYSSSGHWFDENTDNLVIDLNNNSTNHYSNEISDSNNNSYLTNQVNNSEFGIDSNSSNVPRVLGQIDCLALSLALMIIPFLPATNLFFYVGFVVAERILYIPSFGFCLFLAICIESFIKLCRKSAFLKITMYISISILVVSFSIRTVLRNIDWLTEENLYRSGIEINPPKAYGNLGNVLSEQGRKTEAEAAYRMALNYRFNMADVHYNLGILLQEQDRYAEALESYQQAISFRPRLAIAYLNMGIVLVYLGRKEQAKQVYTRCSQLDSTGLKNVKLHENTKISALYNLGRVYADEGNHRKALEIYKEAVLKMPPYYQAQSLFNMIGDAYLKLNQTNQAEQWFQKSIMTKMNHIPAHLTYAQMLAKQNRTIEADNIYQKALRMSPNDTSIYQHYGQFILNCGKFEYALKLYRKGFQISPDNFDIIINLANTLRELRKNREAEKYYEMATKLRPKSVISFSNLGAIYHLNGKYDLAEKSYLEALKLKPDDLITRTNLAKLKQQQQQQQGNT